MHVGTVALGGFALAFGLATAVLRQTHPQLFSKLGHMKRSFGETGGWAVHFVSYTVVPVVVGITFLVRGLQGGSVF